LIGKYSDQLLWECRETLQKKGGRPEIGEVVMIKILVLQQWYGLSDPEIERKIADRISFCKFLGFPESIPDYSTVWRERLIEIGRDKETWKELQRQLKAKGLKVKKKRGHPRCNSYHCRPPGG